MDLALHGRLWSSWYLIMDSIQDFLNYLLGNSFEPPFWILEYSEWKEVSPRQKTLLGAGHQLTKELVGN